MFRNNFARLPAVAADDLNTPLGRDAKNKRFALPAGIPRAIAAVLGLCVSVFAGWVVFADDPFGGEPVAIV